MNELIEELFEQYARLFMNDKAEMLFTDFKQAIQTACQAQRNACLRVYKANALKAHGFGTMQNNINNAKIERCDYE